MNVWEAMQQELVNIYQFLYHVKSVVICQVKSCSDWTFCWSFKFSSFLIQVLFFKNFRTLPMICKLSPVEVSLFQRKKWPPNRKRLLFGVRVAKGKKSFCRLFDIEDNWSMVKSRFHKISTSNEFSNLVRIRIRSEEQFFSVLSQDIWKELSIENLLINLSQSKHGVHLNAILACNKRIKVTVWPAS